MYQNPCQALNMRSVSTHAGGRVHPKKKKHGKKQKREVVRMCGIKEMKE